MVHGLARGQSAHGHAVRVVAVLTPDDVADHPFISALSNDGIATEIIEVAGREYRRERAALRSLLQRLRPDVIHTHGYRPDVLDAGVARRMGIPTVSTVHGFTGGDVRNRLYEWLQRRAHRDFAAVISVSKPISERLRAAGVHASRLHVLPNAWIPEPPLARSEAREALAIPADARRIAYVGRLSHEKGADVLLDAFARLRDTNLTLSIVGDGPERAILQSKAGELSIADRITWHGMVPGAHRYFRAFDAFVLSSRTEGTPVTLLEAMGAGVPIVVTRVGGVPAVVGPDEALLVASEQPAALAAAMDEVFRDESAAQTRVEAARMRVLDQFSTDAWLERHDEIYARVLGDPSESGVR